MLLNPTPLNMRSIFENRAGVMNFISHLSTGLWCSIRALYRKYPWECSGIFCKCQHPSCHVRRTSMLVCHPSLGEDASNDQEYMCHRSLVYSRDLANAHWRQHEPSQRHGCWLDVQFSLPLCFLISAMGGVTPPGRANAVVLIRHSSIWIEQTWECTSVGLRMGTPHRTW